MKKENKMTKQVLAPCGQSHKGSYVTETVRMCDHERRLFNFAPDLLAACKKARESLLGMKEFLNSMGAAYGLGATWEILEKAIAKAEGKDNG